MNDSRLRIYEQLEVSIQDLERANHRLAVENATDKKQIKALTSQIETLETKCEELQTIVDDLKVEIETYKRKVQKAQAEKSIKGPNTDDTLTTNNVTLNQRNVTTYAHSLQASHKDQVIFFFRKNAHFQQFFNFTSQFLC